MEEMIKQKETINSKQESHTGQKIASIIFGVIEVALGFRLVFKLLGANPENAFVQGIYAFTRIFVGIFEGIFSRFTTKGAETTAVFEPATLIAMVVIAVIAYFVLKLIVPRSGNLVERTEYMKNIQ